MKSGSQTGFVESLQNPSGLNNMILARSWFLKTSREHVCKVCNFSRVHAFGFSVAHYSRYAIHSADITSQLMFDLLLELGLQLADERETVNN